MARINYSALLLACLAVVLEGCTSTAQTPYIGSCAKPPKFEIESLAFFPDPLPEARKIDQWRAIIRSDSSEICPATLAIVEAGKSEPITREAKAELTIGVNNVLFYAVDSYRMSGTELCFELAAYINGNKAPMESPRPFCAQTIDRGWWSMR